MLIIKVNTKHYQILYLLLTLGSIIQIIFRSYTMRKQIFLTEIPFKNPQNISDIQYNERSSSLIVPDHTDTDFIEDQYLSFFANGHAIEIMDGTNNVMEQMKLMGPKPKEIESNDSYDRDALTAVKKALEFKEKRNMNKARRLFDHALRLSPNHHDVLLHYGEFLESSDVIDADHFYLKAIMLRPKNSKAFSHRKRTLPIVIQQDMEELKRIDLKRDELIHLKNKDPAGFNRLRKEINFQHIHDTVAIEGNTMSLPETRTVVEGKLAVPGKSVLELNKIRGKMDAVRYINETLTNNQKDIQITHILEIHRRVMGYINPMIAGTFRKDEVSVGEHIAPAASHVELLMDKFVRALKSPILKNMHPIHIAAFVHHKFVFIHPFEDGNGRTSRLLMNLILERHEYLPIVIRTKDRDKYRELLQEAHESDLRPFYRFIAGVAKDTMDVLLRAYENKEFSAKGI